MQVNWGTNLWYSTTLDEAHTIARQRRIEPKQGKYHVSFYDHYPAPGWLREVTLMFVWYGDRGDHPKTEGILEEDVLWRITQELSSGKEISFESHIYRCGSGLRLKGAILEKHPLSYSSWKNVLLMRKFHRINDHCAAYPQVSIYPPGYRSPEWERLVELAHSDG